MKFLSIPLLKSNLAFQSKRWTVLPLLLLLIAPAGAFVFSMMPKNAQTSGHYLQERGPYLSWTMDPRTSMTITWETGEAENFVIEYGIAANNLSATVAISPASARRNDGYFHYTVTLAGLSAGTEYYYRIPGFLSTPRTFRTAPKEKRNFSFILYGDSRETKRMSNNEHFSLVRQMERQASLENELAFVINAGDIARAHDDINSWNQHFSAIREIASRVPYFVASGNHEWNKHGTDQTDQPTNWIHEYPSADRPEEAVGGLHETSYAFGYGCAYFIFLGFAHQGVDDPEINRWLKEQLAIGNAAYDFTFVTGHIPPFDRRENGYRNNREMIAYQCSMFHAQGVDAVFSGHNHVLAHQEFCRDPTGKNPAARKVTYLTSGGGGAPLSTARYGNWENDYDLGFYGHTVYAKRINHFFKIDVSPGTRSATFTCFDMDGNVVYSPFTLKSLK